MHTLIIFIMLFGSPDRLEVKELAFRTAPDCNAAANALTQNLPIRFESGPREIKNRNLIIYAACVSGTVK